METNGITRVSAIIAEFSALTPEEQCKTLAFLTKMTSARLPQDNPADIKFRLAHGCVVNVEELKFIQDL